MYLNALLWLFYDSLLCFRVNFFLGFSGFEGWQPSVSNKLAKPTAALVSLHKRHAEQTAYLSTLTKSIRARRSSDSNTYVSFRRARIDSAIRLCISLSCFIFPNPPVSSSRTHSAARLETSPFKHRFCLLHTGLLAPNAVFGCSRKNAVLWKITNALSVFVQFAFSVTHSVAQFVLSVLVRRCCRVCPLRAYGVTRSWHSSFVPCRGWRPVRIREQAVSLRVAAQTLFECSD